MSRPFLLLPLVFLFGLCFSCSNPKAPVNKETASKITDVDKNEDNRIISHIVDVHKNEIKFYWKDKKGSNFKNIQNLKNHLSQRGESLVFAMNGGMYMENLAPLGLYIEDGKVLAKLNSRITAHGNFYLQPNGIFYLTKDGAADICKTTNFKNDGNIKYATQSGPMLLIDGVIHSKLTQGSQNLHIRNGVGILPNGNLIFAISKKRINFYDFASFFKAQGCQNALYLDGFVSRMYLPSKNWEQLDGNFGVIIGETSGH